MEKLTLTELGQWVESNLKFDSIDLTALEQYHIVSCLSHLQRWYYDGSPIGDFLTAVVKDKFTDACCQADATNQKALVIYAKFCYNKLPGGYREKANV